MKIYNGEGMILGRLASQIAKDLLLGEDIKVVNCTKILISGRKINTVASQKQRRERKGHPLRSQSISRTPDRFVRRSIRGMLPWKFARGKEAFRRVMCYNTVPEQFQGKQMVTLKNASVDKLPSLHYISVQELCRRLGGKQ